MADTAKHRCLILLRHAKSSWALGEARDHERPLNARGRHAAPLMGAHLASAGLVPDLVLCSDAARARETWARLRPVLGAGPQGRPRVRYCPDLYLAEAPAILARLARLGDRWRRVMVVGHNPGLQTLATRLAARADPAAARRLAAKFPTAAAAVFRLGGAPWSALGPDGVRGVSLTVPRDLKDR